MTTTETMLNKPADPAENNNRDNNSPFEFHKDVAEILTILDNFGAKQQAKDRIPEDGPLTAEERNRLTCLLGNTDIELKEKDRMENKDKRADISQVEATDNHETLGKEIDCLLTNIQTQLETVIVDHEKLSRELDHSRALVDKLENDRPGNEAEKPNLEQKSQDIDKLRSELTKITKWHQILTMQVQKLLKVVEDSHAENENLEASLFESREIIRDLKKKVQPLENKIEDYDKMVTDLHTQFADQTAILTETHERLFHEVSQRREVEQILRKIKSRLGPLTRTRR